MKQVTFLCALVFLVGLTDAASAQDRRGMTAGEPRPLRSDVLVQSAPTWGANNDGIFTCEEWKQYAARIFNMADRNRNGTIETSEFETIRNADKLFADADLAYFDTNGDGKLSRSEFVDKPSPFFARYDKDGNCKVTKAEMSQSPSDTNRGGGGGGKKGGRKSQ